MLIIYHDMTWISQQVYIPYSDLQMVVAFTRGDVKLDVVKGGKFELFGGNISGEYENIVSFFWKLHSLV